MSLLGFDDPAAEEASGAASLFSRPAVSFEKVAAPPKPRKKEKEKVEAEPPEKKKRTKKEESPKVLDSSEKSARTIFVGNLPFEENGKKLRKELKRYFGEFGTVESTRLRSLPTAGAKVETYDEDLVKKVSTYEKNYLTTKQTANGYVVFTDSAAAQAATIANGREFRGRHLRVDVVGGDHDHQRTAFVGNVPHDVDEEALRAHFADHLPGGHSSVDAVRVVRDKTSHTAIGVAYVLLKDRSVLLSALRLNGLPFANRNLRVTTCGKRTKRHQVSAPAVPSSSSDHPKKPAAAAAATGKKVKKPRHRDGGARQPVDDDSAAVPSWMGRRSADTNGPSVAVGTKKRKANPSKPKDQMKKKKSKKVQ